MATQEIVKAEASLAAERTFTSAIDIHGDFNIQIGGTWAGTLTTQRKFVSHTAITGEASATTSDKLVDDTVDFTALDVRVGDWAHNTENDTWAMVTAIDGATTLSIDGDIMADGEGYSIERWWDLAESGEFTENADAVGHETEGGVQYRIGFKDGDYTSGTAYVRISK